MPKPIKWREMVRRLRAAGWGPPEGDTKHPAMWKEGCRIIIPNPHQGDVDWSLMKRIPDNVCITPEEWDRL